MALRDTIRSLVAAVFPPEVDPAQTTEQLPPESSLAAYTTPLARYIEDRTKIERTRLARYRDYDTIDEESAEISSALDVFASNTTHADEEPHESFAFETDDEELKKFLDEAADRTRLREDAWTRARDLAKYGDDFVELVFDGAKDLVRVKPLDRFKTFRNEDDRGRLPERGAFYQADTETGARAVEFDAFQVVHYRLRRSRASRYGMSVMHSSRKLYRQLAMVEDGLILTRLTRATMRYAHMVDTLGLQGTEAMNYVRAVRDQFKKRQYVDAATGTLRVQDNPLAVEDDLWLPQGPEGKSDVKVLQGQANLGEIHDVEYFRNKLFAGIKVPKAYLGLEADTRARAVMTELDVQFARQVRRLQRALAFGDKESLDRALAAKGIAGAVYAPVWPPISTVDELREWEVEKVKAEIAKVWGKDINEVSTEFLLRKYLGLTDKEIADMGLKPKPAAAPSFGGFGEDLTPPVQEVYAHARLASALETLRELADWEIEGKRWERAADPVRRGRRIFVPAGDGGPERDNGR